MTDIARHSNINAVSFEHTRGLSKAQRAIYNVLVYKARVGAILTISEIEDLYLQEANGRIYDRGIEFKPNDEGVWVNVKIREPQWIKVTRENHQGYLHQRATHWFKLHLANCIIKGKIMAIPIIEV